MTVEQNVPTRSERALFVVMQMSASVFFVLLAAAFISGGVLFESVLMRGVFAWACIALMICVIAYVLWRFKPFPNENN